MLVSLSVFFIVAGVSSNVSELLLSLLRTLHYVELDANFAQTPKLEELVL